MPLRYDIDNIYVYEHTKVPVFLALLPTSYQQPSFFWKFLKKRNETHHLPSFSLSCPQVSGPMSADFSFIFLAVPLINVTRNSRYKLICFVIIATWGIKLMSFCCNIDSKSSNNFFLAWKVLFSQVNVTTKFCNRCYLCRK